MPADRMSPSRATHSARAPHKKSFEPSEPCEVCGRKMTRAIDLPRHMLIHDPSKRIPCGFPGCSYSAAQKSNLETHMLRHVQNKKYKCKDDPATCSFKTCDRSSLLRHRVRMHGYVPKQTAPKKSNTQGEGSSKRRNPHRVPVRVIRTVNNESDSPSAILSQFSSFQSGSGSGSTSSASVPSAASTPDDTLSDLSELSDLTDSEVGSDSEHSKASIAPSLSSSPSARSSSSPTDELPISAFFVHSSPFSFPQKVWDDCMRILSPWTSKYFTGPGIPQHRTEWSKIPEVGLKLDPLQYSQYLYTQQSYSETQADPFGQPCQMNFDPVTNSSQESLDYSTPLDDIMFRCAYQIDSPEPSDSPSAQSLSPGLAFPDTFQAEEMFQNVIPSDYFDDVLDNTGVAAVCKEEINLWPLNFNSGDNDLAYHDDQMSQYRVPSPDYTSNVLDTPGVASEVAPFDYNQQDSLELRSDLERFNNWSLEAHPNVGPSSWDGQFPAVNEYRF